MLRKLGHIADLVVKVDLVCCALIVSVCAICAAISWIGARVFGHFVVLAYFLTLKAIKEEKLVELNSVLFYSQK